MDQIRRSAFIAIILASFVIAALSVSVVNSQPVPVNSVRHMHNSQLPIVANSNAVQSAPPPPFYDLQVGFTFTEDFSSLAYNVTAIDQIDPDGYGPAYLLNGVSDQGYWYQVGVSYNWPYAIGGYSPGFGFNYQVFAPNQSSVYPTYGGGGLEPFSGPVNSGDTIQLGLLFQEEVVIMYARDFNTGSMGVQVFDSFGSQYFQGSPYAPANQNGYFTGLMTEWYHANPDYRDGSKVTYSNLRFSQPFAWMWMDQWNPYNPSWDGTWFTSTIGPVDYTQNATQIQTLSYLGATAASNAYQFTTGSIVPISTSVTLVQADQSTPLSASNQFQVSYTLNGHQLTKNAPNGTITINADSNTEITISGTSTASTQTEKWVLNAQDSDFKIKPGTNTTLYYYNLLLQLTSFTSANGGNPPDATLTYYTAPETSSNKLALMRMDLSLSASTNHKIFASKGTTVSMINPMPSTPTEQWATLSDTTWTVLTSYQIPQRITYNHQYLLTVIGTQADWRWVNSGATTDIKIPATSQRNTGTGQRITSYAIDANSPTNIQPTTGTITIPVFMNSPHKLTVNTVKQYKVTIESNLNNVAYITPPTIAGDDYWYDQGTTVNVALKSILNRGTDSGERLQTFTVNGVQTSVFSANPVNALTLSSISTSYTLTQTTTKQFKLSLENGSVESITGPSLPGDASWYDAGTQVTITLDYSWNQTSGQRSNAISYSVNNKNETSLTRSGNRTFAFTTAMVEPQTINVSTTTQYALTFSGGFNTTVSQSSPTNDAYYDSDSQLTVSTDHVSRLNNGNTRQILGSYNLDGVTTSVTRAEKGRLTIPQIRLENSCELAFNSGTQYLVSLAIMDSKGTQKIAPDSVTLQTDTIGEIAVNAFPIWLDANTVFKVTSISWAGSTAKPLSEASFNVNAPITGTVLTQFSDARISVIDVLGQPIAGAKVSLTFENGTTSQTNADNKGMVNLQLAPPGEIQVTAANMGMTSSTKFNILTNSSTTLTLFASNFTIILMAVIVIVIIAVCIVVLRARKKSLRNVK